MDYDKLIFTLAVALIGGFAVHNGNDAVAGTCLGIMGAILRPGTPQPPPNTSSTGTVTTKVTDPNQSAVQDTASKEAV